MQRITITVDDDLLETIDITMSRHGFGSRSEVIRDLIRKAVSRGRNKAHDVACMGVLSYVFDHKVRSLSQKLTRTFHDHHDLSVAGLHVHLDHGSCLEVSILRGPAGSLHGLTDALTAQRGVRHASLHLIPANIIDEAHAHGSRGDAHSHVEA